MNSDVVVKLRMKLSALFVKTKISAVIFGCTFICFLANLASATTGIQIKAGSYVRVTKSPQFTAGGREMGKLYITNVRHYGADFRLEVTWNPMADDDGYYTHNGVIDKGIIKINSNKGQYSSSEGYPDLGQCIIDFLFTDDKITLTQKGKCWWFGENVDASGVYRQAIDEETVIVK